MSELEALMWLQIKAAKLPAPQHEYRFHPKRRWRFDAAWPKEKVALEVEGGVWVGGRHTRGAGFEADAEKYNTAISMGWRVLRVTGRHIQSGEALQWVAELLKMPASGFALVAP